MTRIFGTALGVTHLIDIATALAFYYLEYGCAIHLRSASSDVVGLALGRALLFAWACKGKKVALVFTVATASQLYIGVKVNTFHYHEPWQIWLLCSSVLWTNVEAFFARNLINENNREKTLFLKGVHPHGLVFDKNICRHWCDLCQTPICNGAYRCKLCDFDCCVKCANRRDAAVVGENVLRTDGGTAETKRISSVNYLARAVKLASARWLTLTVALMVLLVYSALSLALPAYQGRIIDRVVQGRRSAFVNACKMYLLIMMAQGAMRAFYSSLFSIVSRSVLFEIRTQLFKSILRQDVAFFDGTTSGHLSSRLTNDCQQLMAPIDASLSSLLYNSIMLFGGIVMCFSTSYALSTLAFVVVGPITTLWGLYSTWSKRLTRRVLAAWAEANAIATEALGHARTVKAFAAERHETLRYDDACAEGLRLGIRDAMGFGATTALTSYLDLGTGVLILWYGGLLVLSRDLTVGKLVQFQLYWNAMNSAYQSLQGLVTSFTRAAAAAEKVFSLVDSMPNIDTSCGEGITLGSSDVKGALCVQNVDFYYAMRPDKLVLDNVTLDIPANSTCALVGRSGGGKSTLISILLRFYDPKRGRVLLDGTDVRSVDVRSYRRNFGVVLQDTPLMARSIRRNITYGIDDDAVSDSAVVSAAKQAYADDFIAAMHDGYETRVGERGGRLSGGQRQRVAIARVFLRRPKIILLDEATSALDEESQAAVQNSLDALIGLGGHTVVLVAHRLSTVVSSDLIAVIDAGRVVERGSHNSLVAADGVYAALVKRQLAKAALHIDDSPAPSAPSAADTIDALLEDLAGQQKAPPPQQPAPNRDLV